jgi:hypothetical protein
VYCIGRHNDGLPAEIAQNGHRKRLTTTSTRDTRLNTIAMTTLATNHRTGKKMSASQHSPSWKKSLQYKCSFCREYLRKVPLTAFWLMLLLFGFRRYYCPHCFQMRVRPGGWLKMALAPFWLILNVLKGR